MAHLKLPTPNATEQQHHKKLQAYIRHHMDTNGGSLPFSDFMNMALYAPGLGYYQAGTRKFGPDGDFVTAPELSPLFAYCLANQCQQILASLQARGHETVILELGAGSGKLATDVLRRLTELNQLPTKYWILEPSPELRQRQQHYINTHAKTIADNITWLDRLPLAPFTGIILANEVIDAFPVEKFCYDNKQLQQYHVTYQHDSFDWQLRKPTDALHQFFQQKLAHYSNSWMQPYCSEINMIMPSWLNSLSDRLKAGVMLLSDYGYPRGEYYHPQRHQGSLMCYYKHRGHDNPLILCGLQDITAHVDFTLLAESAITANLNVAGFTHQAAFLLAAGAANFMRTYGATMTKSEQQAIKKLLLPGEMGSAIKLMALSRDFDMPLRAFSHYDCRAQL
ncbi:MAG: SAM-dependent methyltransferase [Pseudomonadota bacterium]